MAADEKMTVRQAEKEIENFKKVFHAVRLFPVEDSDHIRESCREYQDTCGDCNFPEMEQHVSELRSCKCSHQQNGHAESWKFLTAAFTS